jgi:DNA-binding IclR family transcriptional regulator
MTQPESGKSIAIVLNTLRILEEVAQRQPIGVSELSRVTQMPKSTVQRCLVTLGKAGWLRIVDPDHSRWGVTGKPLGIGLAAAGEAGLRDVAGPFIEELRDATNETIHLAVRDANSLLILLRRDSSQAVRTFVEVGTRAPLHATASGIAVLAKDSDDEVEAVLDGDLAKYTDTTLAAKEAVLDEIARTRARGYSVNDACWWRHGVCGVGAAIVSRSGKAVAGLVISIPSSRYFRQNEARYGEQAVATAEKISRALHT